MIDSRVAITDFYKDIDTTKVDIILSINIIIAVFRNFDTFFRYNIKIIKVDALIEVFIKINTLIEVFVEIDTLVIEVFYRLDLISASIVIILFYNLLLYSFTKSTTLLRFLILYYILNLDL